METTNRARSPVLEDVDVVLRDGSTVRVRAVVPEDRDALERFLGGLSEESRVFRFFSAIEDLSWAARRFADVDCHDRLSLVALRGEAGEIVGHGFWNDPARPPGRRRGGARRLRWGPGEPRFDERGAVAVPCLGTVYPEETEGDRMSENDSGTELEEIADGECLQILERHRIGRVGVVVDGAPEIFPVNYAVRDGIIVFRTAPGTKLSYAPGHNVCFEIDGYDSSTGVGWSVVAHGVAYEATEGSDDLAQTARAAMPRPLAPGPRVHRVAIRPSRITGRRFRLHG